MHPIQRRLLVEELVRLRRADEERRYVASQRAGRIDPNPHQIDAVMFALQRIPEGGCILADEVGLGKTIEAGLVIAQLRAEGAERILLITPKPLIGQWREELYSLFGLSVREGRAERGSFDGTGIFIVGRESAGTQAVSKLIAKSQPFDLCVIDEAHEMFASIYRRFDQAGVYREESKHAKTAHQVKSFLGSTPVLLLTATPIQNSLTELWGLVRYVDASGTLLGDLPTFRAVFTAHGDRALAPGADHELRRRLAQVVQRTLRRQAQEFMQKPFVGRRARTFEYTMRAKEKELYDDVTRYLLSPDTNAFRGSHRSLLLLGFHRRMASSKAALAASLQNVVTRLDRMIRAAEGGRVDDGGETAKVFADDLDDDEIAEALRAEESDEQSIDLEAARKERDEVDALRERAVSLADDGKARALIKAARVTLQEEESKLVIFTESLTTQSYLRELLLQSSVVSDDEITLFRGQNTSARAKEALTRWEAEVEAKSSTRQRPSRQTAMRLALVHEFRTRSKVFISTEAGAKGLNLQFADTLINYDLPWNPQRIEQRIGRCHRYGQTRDVTVINFLATDNAAQRLTYEILSQKLELFGTVMGASDVVLHEAEGDGGVSTALAIDFEKQLNDIYRKARSIDEIEAGLRRLRDTTEDRRRAFDEEHARTARLIESRLDESVRRAFRTLAQRLPGQLKAFDQDLERVLVAYLDAIGALYKRELEESRVRFEIAPSADLPRELREGLVVTVGEPAAQADPLHLAHPLVRAAVEEARESASATRRAVRFGDEDLGERGLLRVLKVRYDGLDVVERLFHVGCVLRGSSLEVLPSDEAEGLLQLSITDIAGFDPPLPDADAVLDDALEEALFDAQGDIEEYAQQRFEQRMERIERFVEDRTLLLRRKHADLAKRIREAEHERDQAMSADARTKAGSKLRRLTVQLEEIDEELTRLAKRDDETYQLQRDRAHQLRFAPPTVEVVLDLEWVR